MPFAVSPSVQETSRSEECKDADASALRAIAQAAVNVELFTIPLYMGSLYSIQGMHQITGKDEDFYKNRLWPGPATTANPQKDNEFAFNIIFSVFIEEMLHLQLAANLASAIGVKPCFTSEALQSRDHGWVCYGPEKTVIPHIVDLRDTKRYEKIKVDIAVLSVDQVQLFKAIEQPAKDARNNIKEDVPKEKYFPCVPFNGWTPDKTVKDLPMFGTIGHMYQCYYDYINLKYNDGTDLWQYVFKPGSVQNDLFNIEKPPGHPMREYGDFETTLTATEAHKALSQAKEMLNAITDQGEGSMLKERVAAREDLDLRTVQYTYQPSVQALEADYPRYTDTGQPAPSADTTARVNTALIDHYERFEQLAGLVSEGKVVTWTDWHRQQGAWPRWKPENLQTKTYDPQDNPYDLPSTKAITDAMNRIGQNNSMYTLVSQAAVGAIAGITTVLNDYWNPDKPEVSFPYPSMVGSGDRMAICWALFGKAPDLSLGIGEINPCTLSHACQGLDLQKPGDDNCAAVEIFHTCRGSNKCQAQGGCGFVQKTTGGDLCGFALVAAKTSDDNEDSDDDSPLCSPPGDNKCAGFGGCAVPISASQVFPKSGTMQLYDFDFVVVDKELKIKSKPFGTMCFHRGEKVHDVAYRAYLAVLQHRNDLPDHGDPPTPVAPEPLPAPPQPNDLRLVFPPST
jgi:hypothetical protein